MINIFDLANKTGCEVKILSQDEIKLIDEYRKNKHYRNIKDRGCNEEKYVR